ncbi:sensor histidine kinase [Granulosicoccus antarcticus]|uniref:histidine kinase n=1 Tax=Granulosicoccus antarcticus IMCC3135 TaxID=1192854 RepID=A0A2Z2P5G3_9GAMM|nr:HAMP domain-containing sensor histidine kinase [Granulosicoccus antarcticus]ASJ76740.1 Phytochrome-like protein cph1 [Granulosicoccus antarcticus IMCC3135]
MLKLSQLMSMSGQIVFRLRLVFLCILLALALAGALGGYQLSYLVNSQENAIQRAVPSLVTAHELQSELASVLELKERLRQTESVAVLTRLDNRIQLLLQSLRSRVNQGVTASTPEPNSPLSTIGAGLSVLDQLLTDSVPLRAKLIGGHTRLREQRQMLVDLRTQFEYRIEPRVIEAAFVLSEALDNPEPLSVTVRDSIKAQVVAQKSLSELSFRVMAVIDLAEQMSFQVGSSVSAEGAADLQFRLRNVAQILASLENDPFRRQLALVLRQLHDLIQGKEGLIAQLDELQSVESSLDTLLANQSAVVKSVSLNVDKLVIAANSDIDASSRAFSDALSQTLTLLLIASLLITVIIVWVSYQVVERQIGRRMTKLTSAVLDIAGGDTQRVVAIEGNDEIGKMASSLEVFKDNACRLRETSAEMEQFVYAAAHDLRSPLRVIESLAQWTIEDGEDLPEDCLENLHKILQRAQRLSALQSDLLDYSRAGQVKESLEMLDLSAMVSELAELIDPEGCFSIQMVGDMPGVTTYATPLRQVVLNLLTNAIKHHDKDHGKIEVRVQLSGERMNLSVQDDGAGIEPCFQAQIFELFNTLKSKDEVEGSGLGLALILKLVTRYGGKVQVESDPDAARGATFAFDWPVQSILQRKPGGAGKQAAQLEDGPRIPFANSELANPPLNGLPADKTSDEDKDVSWREAS